MFLNNYLFDRSVKNNSYLKHKNDFLSIVPKTQINNFSVYLLNNENITSPNQKKQKGIIEIIDNYNDENDKIKNIKLNGGENNHNNDNETDYQDDNSVDDGSHNSSDGDSHNSSDGDDVVESSEDLNGGSNNFPINNGKDTHIFGGSEIILDNLSPSVGGSSNQPSDNVKNIAVSFF